MNEQHAVGEEKISITITRKTQGDKVVSQHASERWFTNEREAVSALAAVLVVFIETDGAPLALVHRMHDRDPGAA